jgi:outer membrane protein OmpA-like peptidoglycan-associated protein
MPRAQNPSESSRADWLPWFLSIFVAGCAAFVLVKGVLPARSVNAHLLERVSRLETAAQNASNERASLEQAKGHLLEQYTSVQAQLSSASKERERALQAQQLARKEMSETFAEQIAAGDLWLEQRSGSGPNSELVIGIAEPVLFNGDHAEVTWKGRRFLKALAENLKHLPAEQTFEIDSHFDASEGSQNDSSPKQNYKKAEAKPRSGWDVSARRAASVARRLEEDGGLAGSQLIATGLSRYHSGSEGTAASNAAASRSIELVLLAKELLAKDLLETKTHSPL